jgi:hypothetical protein
MSGEGVEISGLFLFKRDREVYVSIIQVITPSGLTASARSGFSPVAHSL